MTVMSFIASLVDTLAWPVILLVLVLIFRQQVAGLITNLAERMRHLKRLQTPAGSAEFDDELIKVKKDIAPIAADEEKREELNDRVQDDSRTIHKPSQDSRQREPSDVPLDQTEEPNNQVKDSRTSISVDSIVVDNSDIKELQWESPEAMLLGAWSRLQVAVNIVAFNLNIKRANRSFISMATAAIERLSGHGALDDPVAATSVVARLAKMRNSVAHSRIEITKLQAYEYAVSALQISNFLINSYNRLPPKTDLFGPPRQDVDGVSSPSS